MSILSSPSTTPSKRPFILASLAIVVVIIVAVSFLVPDTNELLIPESLIDIVNTKPEKISAITLHDQNKKPFSIGKFRGKWSFIVFGYTNCPDVCPTTLLEIDDLALLLKDTKLSDKQEKSTEIQYLFVSIDPKRDTAEELSSYLAYFDAGYIGLTGTEAELRTFTDQVGVKFSYTALTKDKYAVNHSSHMVLIDPWGRYLAHFPAPQYATDIRDWFSEIKKLSL